MLSFKCFQEVKIQEMKISGFLIGYPTALTRDVGNNLEDLSRKIDELTVKMEATELYADYLEKTLVAKNLQSQKQQFCCDILELGETAPSYLSNNQIFPG